MNNLIERSREDARTQAKQYRELKAEDMLAWKVADRIEELESENKKYYKALESLAKSPADLGGKYWKDFACDAICPLDKPA